jgi:ABC-type sugar transport system substrate-binding protein
VQSAFKANYDAIILMSVTDKIAQMAADKAQATGVPLIYLNVMPPFDRFKSKVAIVASNDLVAGRLQMRLLADKLKDKGNVVVLRGEDAHPATKGRTQGVKEILAIKPGLKLIAEASGNWGRAEAERLIAKWLSEGKRIDAVAANNDEMALGAIDALRKAGFKPGDVFVGGVDGTKDALEAMKFQYLTVTLLQNAKAQALHAVSDAKKFAQGATPQLYDWVAYELIIPSNVEQYLKPKR